jgi:hypothetical protein
VTRLSGRGASLRRLAPPRFELARGGGVTSEGSSPHYVAAFVSSISKKKGVVPGRSFEQLRIWLRKPGHAEKLGSELASVVQSCEWFPELRHLRDDLVHYGADQLAFPDRGAILFQVYKRTEKRILLPAVMHSENVVDFERYGALVWARLVVFLEDLAVAALRAGLVPEPEAGPVRAYNPGIAVLAASMKDLIDRLENPRQTGRSA